MTKLTKKINEIVIQTISSCLLLLVFTTLDYMSYGTKLVEQNAFGDSSQSISMIIYLYSTIGAQICYGIFTGLSGGVCAGAIVEAICYTKAISSMCADKTKDQDIAICCFLISLSISTLLFSALSYLLYKYKIGNILKYMPLTAIYGVMVFTGIVSLECGYEEIYDGEPNKIRNIQMIASALLAAFAVLLELKYPDFFMLIPTYIFVVLVLFYSGTFIFGNDLEWLRNHELIPKVEYVDTNLKIIFKALKFKNIDFSIILSCWKYIIGLTLFNFVHLPVNVAGYAEYLGLRANLNDELKTQAIGNFITAFLGYPSYFICSTSIYFDKSGGKGRLISVMGSLGLLILVFMGSLIKGYLPKILVSIIPMFIGFSFLYSYVYIPFQRLSYLDFTAVILTAIVSKFYSPSGGLIFGFILNSLYFVGAYIKKNASVAICRIDMPKTEKNNDEFENLANHVNKSNTIIINNTEYNVLKFNSSIFYGTLEMFREKIINGNQNIVIDLRTVEYIDADANLDLEKFVLTIVENNCNVLILGQPINLYDHLFTKYMYNYIKVQKHKRTSINS